MEKLTVYFLRSLLVCKEINFSIDDAAKANV